MVDFRRLEDADLNNKTVLVRVDFNVPVDDAGQMTDATRIDAAVPTIRALQEVGAKIILLSHFGRPKGKIDPALSLSFILPALKKRLGENVSFTDLDNAPSALLSLSAGDVLLLENMRFYPGEEAGDPDFAKRLSLLGNVYVQDAFSAAHRAHASSAGIAEFLPAYAGLAMERELDHISQALDIPRRPVMAIVGGAKVSTKIDLLQNLVAKLDILVIGGGMANTFLAAKGFDVKFSLCEHDLLPTAREIMGKAANGNCRIILPKDVVAAETFAANAKHTVCYPDDVPEGYMILDAGPETLTDIFDAMDEANTLIWNGPLGAFELEPFDTSTVEAAQYAAKCAKQDGLIAVAGGGDTVSALNVARVSDDFTFISTAGGAFLEWMEGKPLPGVEILRKKDQ